MKRLVSSAVDPLLTCLQAEAMGSELKTMVEEIWNELSWLMVDHDQTF